ncbi:MAG: 50S ribosomal protein L29 [Myxococcota bacterium]
MADDKQIRAAEMRDRSDAELQALLNGKREELHQVGFKHAIGQLRETHQLKGLKRDIARIETVLAEKRRAEQGADS